MDKPPNSRNGMILIVDDEPMLRSMLKSTIERTTYNCSIAQNGEEAIKLLAEKEYDIVVTDIDMPVMGGIELAKITRSQYKADIIVMTGQTQNYHYDEMINIGASDFVEKPFSPREMILRIDRVIRERILKKEAQKAHKELKASYIDSIHRLVMAAEYKDEDTGTHIIRIGNYSRFMAEKLNQDEDYCETIFYASPMHDIGKIGIPDKILLKPGKLTDVEFDKIKTHTVIGANLLSNSKSKILQMGHDIALNHHERFNGKGYPNQLKGANIPLCGKIVALADTFDALTSRRPYKAPYPPEVAFDIMQQERGEHFDPDIFDIFKEYFDHFIEIRSSLPDMEECSGQDYTRSERDQG